MTAPVSACLIVRDDPHLEKAIASVRPYVAEVCIACTTPFDVDGGEQAAALADRFTYASTANGPDDRIADFSVARAASFALATQPFLMWLDSDDLVLGAEHLPAVLERLDAHASPRALARYEYAHDIETGECRILQWRERIVRNDGRYHWEHPVHETLVAVDGQNDDVRIPELVWKHCRTEPTDSKRNLRILQRWAETHADDPWTQFNLAHELARAGEYREAKRLLELYVASSGWDEQRVMAYLKLVECEIALDPLGKQRDAMGWAKRAAELRPDWFEPLYAQMRLLMLRSHGAGDEEPLRELLALGRVAIAKPETDTPLAVHPVDRSYQVHELMRSAAEAIGDWDAAEKACEAALVGRPRDPGLVLSRKRYATMKRLEELVPEDGLDIVIACGPTLDPFNPDILATTGVGGSETAVIEMSKRLAARGNRVRVYCYCGREGTWDGVDYLDFHSAPHGGRCDILIAWRSEVLLSWMDSAVRIIWAHDTVIAGMGDKPRYRVDRVFALSEWHKGNLVKAHGLDPEIVWVTGNGIDPARFDGDVSRDPHRVIYSSSPDRGLAALLDMWPAIRLRVPDATLHVFYGFDGWSRVAKDRGDPHQRYLIESLQARMREMGWLGVRYHGKTSQKALAKSMMSAGVWAYPTWWVETSCITAMEAQAAGLRSVTTPLAALNETVGENGTLIEGDWLDPDYQRRFTDAVVRAMTDESGLRVSREDLADSARKRFSWDRVADSWCAEFDRLMQDRPRRTDTRASGIHLVSDRPKLQIILAPSVSGGLLDPHDPTGGSHGGGCPAGFMGLARALGRLGTYDVTAISTFKERQTIVDGVRYIGIDEQRYLPDVMVAYYDVRALWEQHGCLRIGMHHTLDPFRAWPFIDVNTAPSEYAVEHMRRFVRPRDEWAVVPNGVEGLEGVTWNPVPGRVIYHTSPDRGLHHLVERWPEIRERVPHATLHVVGSPMDAVRAYGGPQWRGSLEGDMARSLESGLVTAKEAGGLRLLGKLPRAELLRELSEAACFAFPCDVLIPCETWSISIHECCAIGVPVVLAPADALASLWGSAVRMTPEIAGDRGEFADAVVEMLTRPERARAASERQRRHVEQYSFDRSAVELDHVIREHLPVRDERKAAE